MIERHLPSTCHPGRELASVDGLVVHYISDRYQHPEDPFNIEHIIKLLVDYGLSYHVLIPREGDPIELLPPNLEAWHAGRSRMNGRDYCNRWTHGVALVGGAGWEFTDSQILHLGQYAAQDMTANEYTTDDIAGHDAVREQWNAAHPDKATVAKHDPGEMFPWSIFLDMLHGADMTVRGKL